MLSLFESTKLQVAQFQPDSFSFRRFFHLTHRQPTRKSSSPQFAPPDENARSISAAFPASIAQTAGSDFDRAGTAAPPDKPRLPMPAETARHPTRPPSPTGSSRTAGTKSAF